MIQPAQITQRAINKLMESGAKAPAVTIYLPTHPTAPPPHMTEDQIRAKNLIGQAITLLKDRSDGKQLAAALEDQLIAMLGDQEFWKNLTTGLLIAGRGGELQLFYLPLDTEEYVAVDDQLHLAPIFGLLQDAQEYYVLTVSQHSPTLLQGNMYELRETNIKLPQSVEAGLNIDETNQQSEQQRSAAGQGAVKNGANQGRLGFNGRGGARNPQEEDRHRFWRMIDHIISDKANKKLPLLLAGTESELAEYRAVSHYPNILTSSIAGSFANAQAHELLPKASQIIEEELIQPEHEQATEIFERLNGAQPDRVVAELEAITSAARDGRIDNLLISMVRQTADTVRDNAEQVAVLSFQASQKINQALQQAALAVWQTGGHIINIEPGMMPKNGAYALATLRY